MFKKISAVSLVLLLLLTFSFVSFADFGDYAGDDDYGGGGYDYGDYDNDDYDYGGGGSSSSEKTTTTYYKYGKYPEGNINYGICRYYDTDGEEVAALNVRSTDEDDTGTGSVFGAFVLGILLIVGTIVLKGKYGDASVKSPKKNKAPIDTGVTSTPTADLKPINTFKELDPEFSETEFKEKLSNTYIKLQNAWQDKNLEEVRPYLTDTLYGQFDRQLDAYRRNKQTNYIERIAVLSVDVKGWKQDGDNDLIVAELRTRIVDYVTSDTDGSLVRGSKTAEKFMTYEWTLSRKTGVVSRDTSGTHTVNCPNCGAAVDINKSAKCPFCGSIITTDSSDWTINGIKGLGQRTR